MKAAGSRQQAAGERLQASTLWLLLSTFCLLPAACCADATGAKIDESKVAKTYYVDAAGADAADDDKHGTQDSPFLTIKRALDAALRDKDANLGARILIGPGTYRESIDIPAPAHADTDAPLVIEATERDQTVIDAADADGWTADTWSKPDKATQTIEHPWPFRASDASARHPSSSRGGPRGAAPARGSGEIPRADLVFFNGVALRPGDAHTAPAPGTFFVGADLARGNGLFVSVRLPEDPDNDQDGSDLQVGVRDHGMLVTDRRNVVVRGLLFQHAANPAGTATTSGERPAGLVFVRCANVLVEDVLSQWNDDAGLVFKGSAAEPWSERITLRRVQLIHNGGSGLVVGNLKNLLAEDCETSFNNFREEWTGSFDPQGAAGVKAHGVHGSAWRRQRAVGNACRGLWWTGDCTDLLVEDAVVRGNLFSGLLIEDCPGPSVVRGCFVSGNKIPPGGKPEAGQPAAVSLEASPDVTLENNVVAGNPMPQLGLRDVAERTDGTNFETGAKTTLRAERHVYHHNAFCGADANQLLCDLPASAPAGKSDFGFYYGTLDTDENCFWNPASESVFAAYTHNGVRTKMPLAAWRSALAGYAGPGATVRPEAGSLWTDPLFMEPGEGDYRLQTQSPLIDWGLPSDEGAVAQ